ncbi:MAG: indolepyruvate oxidoreductase subunit beta [Oscillospiraceae bacterium]
MKTKSIMITGVGGQGSLLASKLLGRVLMNEGYDVKVSEVHGMAQRGGSVVTYVKFGDKVYSPVIEQGEADILISFEKLEAARWIGFLKEDGKIITSTQQIKPMPVVTGAMEYPKNLIEKIQEKNINITAIDALSLANKAGNSKAVNVVLIGVLASKMDFEKEKWLTAITQCVPQKFLEINKNAFEFGFNFK